MKLKRMLITGLTALTLFAQTLAVTPVNVYAGEAEGVMNEAPPEAAEGEAVEGEGGELPEGELPEGEGLEEQGTSGVAVSSIQADNGLYIAASFPESEMPAGFTANTVNYQGEDVMLAQMVTKSTSIGTEGMTVTLAYLTEQDGSSGEFYLCDVTENAKMSDMIKIDGADGRYIIVLDPGDNITGPDGFVKHNLAWGSKSAVAWSLPSYSSDEEESEDKKKEDKDSEKEDSDAKLNLFSVKVYAADPFAAGAGSGEDEESSGDEGSSDGADQAQEAAEKAMSDYIEESNIAHTNASGLIEAQPEDFCLLYAVDEEGNVGFYLYDISQKIYQRYVDIPKGEGATLAKYRKQSRIRLIIIIVMAVALLIMLFVLINTLTRSKDRDRDGYSGGSSRGRYREDDEDEEDISDLKSRMDRNRRRPAPSRGEEEYRRSRRSMIADEEDMDDMDEEEDRFGSARDDRSYRGRGGAQSRYPAPAQQPQRRGAAPSSGRPLPPRESAAPYDAPRGRMSADEDMRRDSRDRDRNLDRDRNPDRNRDMDRDWDRDRDRDPRRYPQGSGQPQRPVRNPGPQRREGRRSDLDDDFEFEYLKFNK